MPAGRERFILKFDTRYVASPSAPIALGDVYSRQKKALRADIYARRGQTSSGKDPANFASRQARRAAHGALIHEYVSGKHAAGIRTWESLKTASTSFDE